MRTFHERTFHVGVLQPETVCPHHVTCPENVYLEIPCPYHFVPIRDAVNFFRVIVKYGPKRRGDCRSALRLHGDQYRNFENTSMTDRMYL